MHAWVVGQRAICDIRTSSDGHTVLSLRVGARAYGRGHVRHCRSGRRPAHARRLPTVDVGCFFFFFSSSSFLLFFFSSFPPLVSSVLVHSGRSTLASLSLARPSPNFRVSPGAPSVSSSAAAAACAALPPSQHARFVPRASAVGQRFSDAS